MPDEACREIEHCRVCESDALYSFLDLGDQPPANAFVDDPDEDEPAYPLEVVVCEACDHVQLAHTVDSGILFTDYPYFSSASRPLFDHFGAYADAVEQRYLEADDFVVEIGCNDGVLLSQFDESIRRLGVDPADNVTEAARERGVETVTSLFSPDLAASIREDYGEASAICANNVVGHIDDLHALMTGIDTLLAPDGVFVVEVPYLVDLLSNNQFDTIYHEHLSYFSIRAFQTLVEQVDMQVLDINRMSVHGGTIRVHIQRESADRAPKRVVDDYRRLELALSLDDRRAYDEFAHQVERTRERITSLLDSLREDGSAIVGYAAPAKGNTLLNYCDIGPETLDYLIDTTPAKQGTYSPGMNIPVKEPDVFHEDAPEYAFLLAWNYKDAILGNEADYREGGGQFVVPIPYVNIV
ncbi:class I SAM-dependent methyltransferase [Halapricum salinum]|uniref:Class I SAM-dependent methyltransferase n=1 Tax=Halapricum salinum TaxID=1457250 RepID=A0A4D6HF99_9EURY|nr:class I SAM-dependent methyltransferase [Halapricum salinum]QCC52699.1 class I SAM-dependent methyltransferase [Halapricum salinum]